MWSIEKVTSEYEDLVEGKVDEFTVDDIFQILEETRDSSTGDYDTTRAICYALQFGYIVGYKSAKQYA